MADNLELAISLLSDAEGRADIAEALDKLGGVTGFLKVAGPLLRLAWRVNKLNAERPAEAMPMQYGLGTFAEVKAFQRKYGLDDDGILGDRSWLKIKQLVAIAEAAKK